MKRNTVIIIIMAICLLFASSAFSNEISVATGGKGGFYHNGLYNFFNTKVKRFSDREWECEKASEKGTDGTLHNIKLVESGKANVGFVQLGGLLATGADVEVIGIIMYELAHLIAPKGSNVGDVGDLESKKGYSVGINSRSGSQVTFNVFKEYDKDYGRASVIDAQKDTKAIASLINGKLDSYFFVSAPGTKTIMRAKKAGMKFLDVDDSDFNDLKYNGKRLYEFVKVGKKQGYPNSFKTICVPAVLIANKAWLEDNGDIYDILFDATAATMQDVKVHKKLTYYKK